MTRATVELPFHQRDLGRARELLAAYLKEVKTSGNPLYNIKQPSYYRGGRDLLDLDPDEQVAVVLAAIAEWVGLGGVHYSHETVALSGLLGQFARRKLPFAEGDIAALAAGMERLGQALSSSGAHSLLGPLEAYARARPLPEAAVASLRELRARLAEGYLGKDQIRTLARLDELVGGPAELKIGPGEPWSDAALAELGALREDRRTAWAKLLSHCSTAAASKPAAKWLDTAGALLKEIGAEPFREHVGRWFRLADRPPAAAPEWGTDAYVVRQCNERMLKGLAWCAALIDDKEIARALGALAAGAYRKVPGQGPRAPAVGNAAIYALGAMPDREGLGPLAVLKVKINSASARKGVEKALEATARRLGLPADEVEELGVPAYGMTDVGRLAVPMGESTAELTVQGDGSTELVWLKPGGKPQKSVPAAAKQDHAGAIKELKATARDIETMVAAQRDRIDNLFLARKSWPLEAWRERYLDHPLVGLIARRLIWRFTTGDRAADGIFHDGRIVGRDDRPLEGLGPETTVAPWHPIGHETDEVLAWRAWLEAHQVRQPFKQAHREVYVLTDAERQTRVYSNRFAAHIVRQHQFNALCGVRGWRNQLRLMVDADYPPATLPLPQWGLRAEFWVEGAGDEYGRDTNETGTYLYLATDQVRFYPLDATQRHAHAGGGGYRLGWGVREATDRPIPLEEVPPLVFSEVMRDVDLFVGVASVGNDPTWADGGPAGRYVDYWRRYSFGDLSATAQTRKAVLERLIPRLKIAGRCSFADRFLVVRGELRTYKIHLGSGNILMEPDDQYLCIVPRRGGPGTAGDRVFLPFEGDATLSIILSKALLLAEDRKITDPTIVSQIQRGR